MGKASREKRDRPAVVIKKERSLFPVVVTSIIVAFCVIITGVVIVGNGKASEPAPAPSSGVTVPSDLPTSVDDETGAVVLGSVDNTLEEYIDFGCPYCGQHYQETGEQIKQFVADGDLTLKIYPLGMLDNQFQGTKFSTRSANALYCVAENAPNSVFDFVGAMFSNQPREGTPGLDDETIVQIASGVGASAAESCITDGTYNSFVQERTRETTSADWFKGTPYLKLNGELIQTGSVIGSITASIG